jgi:hypothetical protein
MSLHYDLVINCDLREDAPAACVQLIAWLCGDVTKPESATDCFDQNEMNLATIWDFQFLEPAPESETFSDFQSRYRYNRPMNVGGAPVYKYSLHYSARLLLDDYFYDCHLMFLPWLARLCEDGFIGFYKEEFDAEPTLMYVKEGELITLPENQ